jgi:hypothetical protein
MTICVYNYFIIRASSTYFIKLIICIAYVECNGVITSGLCPYRNMCGVCSIKYIYALGVFDSNTEHYFDNTLHWNKHRNLFTGLRSTVYNPDDG